MIDLSKIDYEKEVLEKEEDYFLRDELKQIYLEEEVLNENQVDLNDMEHRPVIEQYDKNTFLSEVYMQEEQLNRLMSLIRHKKNVILQGAPGVGKTFTAKRLAYVMMGEKDDSRIGIIQFHQNYTYEDFIMGN